MKEKKLIKDLSGSFLSVRYLCSRLFTTSTPVSTEARRKVDDFLFRTLCAQCSICLSVYSLSFSRSTFLRASRAANFDSWKASSASKASISLCAVSLMRCRCPEFSMSCEFGGNNSMAEALDLNRGAMSCILSKSFQTFLARMPLVVLANDFLFAPPNAAAPG